MTTHTEQKSKVPCKEGISNSNVVLYDAHTPSHQLVLIPQRNNGQKLAGNGPCCGEVALDILSLQCNHT